MNAPLVFTRAHLGGLIRLLREDGYHVIGPTLRGAAIVHEEISDVEDLPAGWTARHAPGSYRIERRADQALFGHAAGPHSWKQEFHPPVQDLLRLTRDAGGNLTIEPTVPREQRRVALLGVRACDLAAIAIQDRVLKDGVYPNPGYVSRRRSALIVAVNCTEPGETCFCASMGTGPRAAGGFDLCLTEIGGNGAVRFVVECGTEAGESLASRVGAEPAVASDIDAAGEAVAAAAQRMGRTLEMDGIKDLLYAAAESLPWDEVAGRCLACASCTMVCPTCFCGDVQDVTDLAGTRAERRRVWDSCFSLRFSYMHGGSVRSSVKSRYRQWLTHKLASWIDQFGTAGCVGCGRCITWCPAGIDLTEVAASLRACAGPAPGSRGDEDASWKHSSRS